MGHDVSGYRNENSREEIAYLRRGAGNPLARTIYQVLGVPEFDGGVSGYGEGRHFTQIELMVAVKSLPAEDELQPEVTFLWDCINKGGPDGAFITFC